MLQHLALLRSKPKVFDLYRLMSELITYQGSGPSGLADNPYRKLFDDFIQETLSVERFVSDFMQQWRQDRDSGTLYDALFQRIIDRIFTSCDAYDSTPERPWEIDAEELKHEVALLTHIWFGT